MLTEQIYCRVLEYCSLLYEDNIVICKIKIMPIILFEIAVTV